MVMEDHNISGMSVDELMMVMIILMVIILWVLWEFWWWNLINLRVNNEIFYIC